MKRILLAKTFGAIPPHLCTPGNVSSHHQQLCYRWIIYEARVLYYHTLTWILLYVKYERSRTSISRTGWFKHKTPNCFRIKCPRRCREIRSCAGIFCDIWVLAFFCDIWVLRDPTFFPARTKRKEKIPFVKGSVGAHLTREQNFSVNKKTAWTSGVFVRSSAKTTSVLASYTLITHISDVKFDVILVIRSQFFEYLRKTSFKRPHAHGLTWDQQLKWVRNASEWVSFALLVSRPDLRPTFF